MNAGIQMLFENQPDHISPQEAAALIGFKRMTIYDMHARPHKYKIKRDQLFFKAGTKLRVFTKGLKGWLISREEMSDEL